ncbi:MAG: FtsQ-type POTRA domain-containing protein [Chlamydiae bacterium]|nr:FtsQ-type POTRA domain-containing protein [Chlamydiota bacterium]MBI3267006.1 FtsQ-type POTRA domain-containing protein [Chlamydiota bacterium]
MLRPKRYVYKAPSHFHRFGSSKNSKRPSWLRKLSRGSLFLFLLTVDLALSGWVASQIWKMACGDSYFTIQKIKVMGASVVSEEEVIERSRLKSFHNIFKANILEARRLLTLEPLFKEVQVWRELPGDIVIQVQERAPLAQVIAISGGSKGWLVDPQGVIVSNVQAASNLYPIIRMPLEKSAFRRGNQVIQGGLPNALKVLEIFSGSVLKKVFDLQWIDLHDKEDVILKGKGDLVIHLGNEEFEGRLLKLLSILDDLKKKKREPLSIDLRFRYVPVVLKEPEHSARAVS